MLCSISKIQIRLIKSSDNWNIDLEKMRHVTPGIGHSFECFGARIIVPGLRLNLAALFARTKVRRQFYSAVLRFEADQDYWLKQRQRLLEERGKGRAGRQRDAHLSLQARLATNQL